MSHYHKERRLLVCLAGTGRSRMWRKRGDAGCGYEPRLLKNLRLGVSVPKFPGNSRPTCPVGIYRPLINTERRADEDSRPVGHIQCVIESAVSESAKQKPARVLSRICSVMPGSEAQYLMHESIIPEYLVDFSPPIPSALESFYSLSRIAILQAPNITRNKSSAEL
jgi:hypothetical protein